MTIFRHARGIVNAVEKFWRTLPPADRTAEVGRLVGWARGTMAGATQQLVDAPEDDPDPSPESIR